MAERPLHFRDFPLHTQTQTPSFWPFHVPGDNSSRLPHWIRIKPVNTQTFILLPFTLNTVYSTLSYVPVCEASQFQLEEIFKDSSSNSYFAIK